MRSWNLALALLVGVAVMAENAAHAQKPIIPHPGASALGRIVFPKDPSVLDAKRDYGAKGDGKTDDTDALQKALDESSGMNGKPTRILYLSNGVYKVTKSLIVNNALGPWLYGETRDGVIIRLADDSTGVTAVLRTHPKEKGPTSADWFMRNLRNFTVDVGNNPETDGIRYYATNTGILQNVRIIGNGKIGLNAGFLDQSGPNLAQDVVIEGFETGIQSQWIWGETLSRITIKNCRKQGIYVTANSVAIENLVVENTPIAVVCDYPNDWKHWGGVVSIVGGKFTGGNPNNAAIKNRSVLYLRDVQTQGYKMAVESEAPGTKVTTANVAEYSSHPTKKLYDNAPKIAPLAIKREPFIAWETDPKKWVCANDFGAKAGDNQDDTEAFQKAIDAAAKEGATVVYFRGIGGGDPNWYTLEGAVHVHGNVRMILGLGFGRIIKGKVGKFVVDDQSAPVVAFRHIDAFGGTGIILENSGSKTMVVESCGVTVIGNGSGDIFMTDCASRAHLEKPGQKLWARQFNPEGDDDIGLARNNGGSMWIMGLKCEGKGVRIRTADKGRTEVYGAFLYSQPMKREDTRPLFDIDNGFLSVMGLREIVFGGETFFVKVRDKQGSETRTLTAEQEGGWIGWSLYR